jgi:hypothetical protein
MTNICTTVITETMGIEPHDGVAGGEPPPPVMNTILDWIGFDQQATRDRIREEGFETFADLATMKVKDVRNLAESYLRRTAADGRAIFGLVRRIRYMIGLIHWVQDFGRIGEEPTLEGIGNAEQYKAALDKAYQRAMSARLRKINLIL